MDNLLENIDEEYKCILRESVKVVSIFLTVYIICGFLKDDLSKLLCKFLTKGIVLYLIGLLSYHLIVKKIIKL